MSESGLTLVVPVSGLLNVLHHNCPLDRNYIQKTLEQTGRGTLISLGIVVDGKPGGTVNFLHEPSEPVNPRAREALEFFTGVHILFTGPVLFTGVVEHKVSEAVALLSAAVS